MCYGEKELWRQNESVTATITQFEGVAMFYAKTQCLAQSLEPPAAGYYYITDDPTHT